MRAKEYFGDMEPNLMTPDVIEHMDTDRYMVELSRGEGFDREPIYGVSVATRGGELLHEESQLFWSESEARGYMEGLTARAKKGDNP